MFGHASPWPNGDEAAADGRLYALHLLRLLQPSFIFAAVLISLLTSSARNAYLAILNADISAETPGSAAARAASASLPNPNANAAADEPGPQPVVVPLRSRRRVLCHLLLVSLAASYFVAGSLIVLHAVLPPQRWTPDYPRWRGSDLQSLLGVLAWFSVAIACAHEERKRGRGSFGRGKILWALVVGAILDVAILSLYISSKPRKDLPKSTAWHIAQLAIIIVRLLLLYPLLLIALGWDKVTFVKVSELRAQQQGGSNGSAGAAEEAAAAPASERTGLLAPGTSAAGYGATSNGPNSGTATPSGGAGNNKANANGARTPHAANASMGLSVAAVPPPPTFTVFVSRLKTLFPYLWPSKSPALQSLAVLCVILLVLGRLVNLLVPIMLGLIVDDLAEGRSPWLHLAFFAALKTLQGQGGLLSVAQGFAWLPIEQYSDRSLSLMAFEHLLNLSMKFHAKRKTGEVLRILDRGAVISSLFQYLLFNVVPIIADLSVAIFYLGRKFGWAVGVTLFVVMWLYVYISVKLTTWRTKLRREANNKDSISRAIHTDTLLNYETVKCFSNEPYELARYRASLLDYQRAAFKVAASLNFLNLCQNIVIAAGTLSTSLLVAHSIVTGATSASAFIVFITYLSQVLGPLGFLGTLYRVVQQNLVDTDKLMGLLEEEKDIKDKPGAKDLVVTDGVVEFKDVYFSYDGKVDALKGVSFTIDPRTSCALVGESGSGKSTILRLLYRFYDITSGQILIDGQDIRDVTQTSLRKSIGICPQDPTLFNTDIKHNILYGDVDASDERVEAAARAAQIWNRIQSFPDGMNTVVGERGVRLSGGERQRVAISRLLLSRVNFVLLDEATSALDTKNEKLLQAALRNLLTDKLSLTVAHRLSTIVDSDQIVVLDAGKVVERGTHAELMKLDGRYAAMWRQQIKAEAEALDKGSAVAADKIVDGAAPSVGTSSGRASPAPTGTATPAGHPKI